MCIIRASPPLHEITTQSGLVDRFPPQFATPLHSGGQEETPDGRRGEQSRIEKLQVGRPLFFLSSFRRTSRAAISFNYAVFTFLTESTARNELTCSTASALLLCQGHEEGRKNPKRNTLGFFCFLFSKLGRCTRPLLAQRDVRKVEGNQRRFRLSQAAAGCGSLG